MRHRPTPAQPRPAAPARRGLPFLPAAVAVVIALTPGLGRAAEAPTPVAAQTPTPSVLRLRDGGFVPGALAGAAPGALGWQGRDFLLPFAFGLGDVDSLHTAASSEGAVAGRPAAAYRFDLAGGGVAFGALVALDGQGLTVDDPRLGRLRLRRAEVQAVDHWRDSASPVYVGPDGLNGWKPTPGPADWRDDGGQPATDVLGAALYGDLGLPARAAVEFELSWKTRPDFVLALGVGGDEPPARRAFRFEVWDGDLVLVREAEGEADLVPVAAVGPASQNPAIPRINGDSGSTKIVPTGIPGRVALRAYLDQEAGRMLVYSTAGRRLADLTLPGPKGPPLPGVSLANKRGDLRLEWLRVGRWDGEPPPEVETGRAELRLGDGSARQGYLSHFDAETRTFVVRDGVAETRVPEREVAGLTLTPAAEPARLALFDDPFGLFQAGAGAAAGPDVRVSTRDGARFQGRLLGVDPGAVVLGVPAVEGPLRVPVAALRSLTVVRPPDSDAKAAAGQPAGGRRADPATAGPSEESPYGRIEADGVWLRGRLVAGPDGGLAWLPSGSTAASPLRPGVAAKVVYRATPPRPAPNPGQGQMQRVRRMNVIPNAMSKAAPTPNVPGRRALHLRSGDVIKAEVTAIDEQGVRFRSPVADRGFVAHERVKAVELDATAADPVTPTGPKVDRLLTLPRVQADSPPTHLICSKNGDYLRGRVTAMDDRRLVIETRLETKELPRDRVSRVIWLHADEFDPTKAPAKAAQPDDPAGTRVQAVRNDGARLSFLADRLEGGVLRGRSDLLGACSVKLSEVDQLLIGGAIESSAADLAYSQWKLHKAPEPKVAQDDGSAADGRPAGTDGPLVGKPAPDFTLDLLGGSKFHLAENKGKVVVLDFWATWCGPCIQAMPQVERVAAEFRDRGVRLIAVNLQENPQTITAMLERHKLSPVVALDRDGTVADKYGATAIPQTVVIDREGKVTRLYVGGGTRLGDNLRDALNALQPAPGGDPAAPGQIPEPAKRPATP